MYVNINKYGDAIMRNKKDFSDVYENTQYKKYNEMKCRMEDHSFVSDWLKDADMRTYHKIDFLPMQQAPSDVYNTFKGYEVEKKELFDVDIENSLIMKHVKNLCDNHNESINYFINVLARKLQEPHKLTQTSMIFKSKEGAGKDLFFNWFGNNIIGSEYYFNTEKAELLFGRFTSCTQNKILVIMNEANGKDMFAMKENIKTAITNEKNKIERKGMEAYENTNHIQLIFLTNNDNPINITHGDRRFAGIECNNEICNNKAYFDALRKEMNSGKFDKAFYNYLMNIDVGDFDFTNDRPVTRFYSDLTELNKPSLILFLEDLVEFSKKSTIDITSSQLFKCFNDYLTKCNHKYTITMTKFILDIKKIDGIEQKRTKTSRNILIDVSKTKEFLTKNFNSEFAVVEFNDIIDDEDDEENPLDM